MKTINEYGSAKVERVNKALESIQNGGFFNGTVYAKAFKKGYMVSVYVDKKEICFGEIQKQDVELVKAEFLAEVSKTNTTNTKIIDERKQYSTMAWLMDGMNYE